MNYLRKLYLSRLILLLSILLLAHSCDEEPQIWRVDSQQQVMGEFISENPDRFSEFGKLMEATGLEALLNTRGPFTLFLPTDAAMQAYYQQKGVTSLEDFDAQTQENLILNHLVPLPIASNDIGLGTLRETNALGDYLVTEFEGSEIIVSKVAKIIDRDIIVANGYVHLVDAVLDPITEDLFTVISSDPSYQIFTEGLELSGLKDTLQIISFPYGNTVARTRFTVLAVADSIYHRYGIQTVDDLVEWCGSGPDSLTYLENPFYRYMEYHCLHGSHFLSDLNTGVYPIFSRDNNIMVTIDTDYKLNYDRETDSYTGFIIPASNVPAKNGAIHSLTDIFPVTVPDPAPVLFETTDFFDLQQGDYYLEHYKRFFDGENTFEHIKWEGNYLLYYFKEVHSEIINHDCLSMLGWWTISITFPKVMKGKYEIYIHQPGWGDVTDCVAYVDGKKTPYIYTGPYGNQGGTGGLQKIAEVNFETTSEHTITLRNIAYGMLFWDYVEFVPVN